MQFMSASADNQRPPSSKGWKSGAATYLFHTCVSTPNTISHLSFECSCSWYRRTANLKIPLSTRSWKSCSMKWLCWCGPQSDTVMKTSCPSFLVWMMSWMMHSMVKFVSFALSPCSGMYTEHV